MLKNLSMLCLHLDQVFKIETFEVWEGIYGHYTTLACFLRYGN